MTTKSRPANPRVQAHADAMATLKAHNPDLQKHVYKLLDKIDRVEKERDEYRSLVSDLKVRIAHLEAALKDAPHPDEPRTWRAS